MRKRPRPVAGGQRVEKFKRMVATVAGEVSAMAINIARLARMNLDRSRSRRQREAQSACDQYVTRERWRTLSRVVYEQFKSTVLANITT